MWELLGAIIALLMILLYLFRPKRKEGMFELEFKEKKGDSKGPPKE